MIFSSQRFFKKTNEWIQLYYYDTTDRLVFVRFLEETEDMPKRYFEINWPLEQTPRLVNIFLYEATNSEQSD